MWGRIVAAVDDIDDSILVVLLATIEINIEKDSFLLS